jgi:flagellar biosynthesis protein FlhB
MSQEHDQEDKQLDASEEKIRKAREEGNVPRSRELASLLVTATAVGIVAGMSQSFLDSTGQVLSSGLTFDHKTAMDTGAMQARLGGGVMTALKLVVPVCAALALVAGLAAVAVGGWNFTTQAIEPKFSKINPINYFSKHFSKNALMDLAKVVVAMLTLAVVGFALIYTQRDAVAGMFFQTLKPALASGGNMVLMTLGALLVVMMVVAAIDAPLALFRHKKELMMTLEEAKREAKESEGDPHLKAKIKQMQREMARKRMMQAVPTADVVVTNPTHYSVALKYQDGRDQAPVVVAMGVDAVALRIREIAAEHKVPVLEAPPLARALYAHGDLGEPIPGALFTAVAQVLAYVFQLKRHNAGLGRAPQALGAVDVPTELDPANKR